ncbi:DASH complex subunit Dad1-domain-containing protein [Mycena galopus ATCC 62051]|nr:DASH complex subunit Dad1-domain-containing protein [Mycena galopus ATCC 62051]
MSQQDEDPSFFERERDRLTREITSDFEELLTSTNGLNRKLEEILGMTKEYPTIAALWSSFYQLMKESGKEGEGGEEQPLGASTSNPPAKVLRDSAR